MQHPNSPERPGEFKPTFERPLPEGHVWVGLRADRNMQPIPVPQISKWGLALMEQNFVSDYGEGSRIICVTPEEAGVLLTTAPAQSLAPAPPVVEPVIPEAIPPELEEFREGEESADAMKTRLLERLRRLLFRFGIKGTDHFLGGGEELNPDEKIEMFALINANYKANDWLDAQPLLVGAGVEKPKT